MKISKELLSEVLNLNITYIDCCNNSIIYKISVYDREEEVNIYELAYKCKEWARDKYDITVSSSIYKKYAKAWDISNDKSYIADTEVEAIIKACEWILNQDVKSN